MKIGQSDGKSFLYLLGAYLGDGCVTKNHQYLSFRLNSIDKDFIDATLDAVEDITGKRYSLQGPYQDKRYSQSKPQYQINVTNQELCKALVRETDKKEKIPDWVFDESKENRLAFIAGLMDSEGYVAEDKRSKTGRRFFMGFRCCDPWIMDFVKILEGVGIKIGKIRKDKPRKKGYKQPIAFYIKMKSFIDSGAYFNIRRKQDRVDEWGATEPYSQRSRYPRKTNPRDYTHSP